jgi:hypothetical protein
MNPRNYRKPFSAVCRQERISASNSPIESLSPVRKAAIFDQKLLSKSELSKAKRARRAFAMKPQWQIVILVFMFLGAFAFSLYRSRKKRAKADGGGYDGGGFDGSSDGHGHSCSDVGSDGGSCGDGGGGGD